jgi:hypothetical protein
LFFVLCSYTNYKGHQHCTEAHWYATTHSLFDEHGAKVENFSLLLGKKNKYKLIKKKAKRNNQRVQLVKSK